MHIQLSHDTLAPLWPTLSDAGIKGTVLLLSASIAALAMPKASAARRHLLWVLALAGALVIPALSALVPGWHLQSGGTSGPIAAEAPAPSKLTRDLAALVRSLPADSTASAPVAATPIADTVAPKAELSRSSWRTPDLRGWIIAAWLAGIAVMLVPVALGAFSVWRLGRRSSRAIDESWRTLLDTVLRQMGLDRPVTILRGGERCMPMTWGILRPKLLIPASADQWSMQRRRVVLMHELAHIQRHDCLAQVLAQVTRAVYWFNPLCWLAARQLTVERELACDDLVLRRGTLASDYAEQLLEVAAGSRRPWGFQASAVAMARPSKLGNRLLAILDPQRSRAWVSRREAGVLITLLALLLVPMSIIKPFAASAAQIGGAGLSGAPAEMAGEMPPLAADVKLVVRIDLKKVTPDQLATTAKVLFGDKSGMFDEPIGQYRPLYKSLSDHEATTVWFSAAINPTYLDIQSPTTCIHVASDVQANALKADLTKTLASPGSAPTITREGQYLVIRPPTMPPPPNGPVGGLGAPQPKAATPAPIIPDGRVTKAFARALAVVPGDADVVLAMIPDAQLTALVEKGSKDAPLSQQALLYEVLHDSESLTLGVKTGTTPSLSVRIQCTDEARAKVMSGNLDEGIVALATHLAEMRQKLQAMASPETADASKLIGPMIDQLKQTKTVVQGQVVELSIDSESIEVLGKGLTPILLQARSTASEVRSMNNMRQLALGIIIYADAHNGQLPNKLEDIRDAVGGEHGFKQLMINPVTNDAVGYIYQKPADKLTDVKNASATAILFEARDGKKKEPGLTGYADGHIENVEK